MARDNGLRLGAVVLIAGSAGVLLSGSAQAPSQAPVFRAQTEAVWVTTTAIDREGRLVTDLARDDFEVLVDGVVQPINQFRNDHIPFALSIMFDLSGSLSDSVGSMRRAMAELINQFRPGDRANVGSFDTLPSVSPRFSANRETLLRSTAVSLSPSQLSLSTTAHVSMSCAGPWNAELWRREARGMSGIWDGIACGIETVAGDAETPRRVVLVITDGIDHVSITRLPEVQALADTYGVMVYIIGMVGTEGMNAGALRTLAAETGGGFFVLNQQEDLTPTFARVADELRHQYVLGYSGRPDEARRGKLEVRVKRPGVTARGRRAMMTVLPVADSVKDIMSVAPASPPALTTAPPPAPAVTDSVFDRYARRTLHPADFPRLSLQGLRLAELELRNAGEQWIRAAGIAQEPVRRIQLATFVLDFLSVQDDFNYWQYHDAPTNLFEWASGLVRNGPPRPEERLWHLAGISLLERFGASWLLEIHLGYARSRFPDEPRFLLARAVSVEIQLWPQRRDERGFVVADDLLVRILGRYEDAIRNAAVRQEAHLRLGYIELLRGRVVEALANFDRAGTPDDRSLRYMLYLLRGKALTAARKDDEAIASLRLAFEQVPYAQSATIALASALVTRGQQNEAASLTSRMLALPAAPFDPWTIYTLPEWRFWEPLMEALRQVGGS